VQLGEERDGRGVRISVAVADRSRDRGVDAGDGAMAAVPVAIGRDGMVIGRVACGVSAWVVGGGAQWNCSASVDPTRARVALSGLSAVETKSK
jgi:hypothetical protein